MYRGFIKNITNLTGNALGSADLRIQSMRIKRDILSKATSEFTVINVPSVAEVGNVFGIYDDYGVTVYLGVIIGVDDKTIETDQIISLFDDNWLWYDPQLSSIELTVQRILQDDFAGSTDALQGAIWSQYAITTSSTSAYALPSHENNYVTNFMDFIFSLYENYEILFDINIPYSTGTPTINITKNTATALQLGNNTYALRNFVIDRETVETNKLVVLSQDASTVRGTYYATTSGITTDSTSLNRLPKINTEYEFSDDDINDIIQSNLSSEMYNHKISCELVLGNKLYDFDDFSLGRKCNIFYNGEYYESILTGYEIEIDNEGKAEKAKLIFGKVRYSLEKKLYAESNKDNIQTSNYALKSESASSADRATYGNISYGLNGQPAATVAKVSTLYDSKFKLFTGAQVAIKFYNSNTASNPTLNVNGTGAKPIVRHGGVNVGTTEDTSWKANDVVILVYDGTSWVISNWWRDRDDDIYLLGETQHRNHYVTQSISVGNTSYGGYTVLATFNIIGSGGNQPIYLRVSERNTRLPYDISIRWNTESVDPTFAYIYVTSNGASASGSGAKFYMYKLATSTWELLCYNSSAYDVYSITDYQLAKYTADKITITYPPEGYAAAKQYSSLPGTLGTDLFDPEPWNDFNGTLNVRYSVDLNGLTKAGAYVTRNAVNAPTGYVNGILVVLQGESVYIKQVYYSRTNYAEFHRLSWDGGTSWTAWIQNELVTEQGTSGSWEYRKYADGKAECWQTVSFTMTSMTSWVSGLYYSNATTVYTYPSGLFTVAPVLTASLTPASGNNYFMFLVTDNGGSSTQTDRYHIVKAYNGTGQTVSINYHAVGRWY